MSLTELLIAPLVHSGFLAQQKLSQYDQDHGCVLTNALKLLLKDNPLSVPPFLQPVIDPVWTIPWRHHARHEPKLDNFFNEAMASDARSARLILPNRHPMCRVKRRRIIVLKPSCNMLPWCCQNRIKHGLQERSCDQTAVFKEKFRRIGENVSLDRFG
ncbi:hypothetical protein WN944_018071 [Citrus x changshan-huyou]|uniref:Uncharacterized protein n=1 Tax=Citrus x changshan-huyou TaxID=2935761 RepID=A0AAP0LSP9_9ROSI